MYILEKVQQMILGLEGANHNYNIWIVSSEALEAEGRPDRSLYIYERIVGQNFLTREGSDKY